MPVAPWQSSAPRPARPPATSSKWHRDVEDPILLALLLVTVIALAVVVGSRDLAIGTDSPGYASFFGRLESGVETRFERGFVAFAGAVKTISSDYRVFFGSIFLAISVSYLVAWRTLLGHLGIYARLGLHLWLVFGLLLSSRWFLTATTNGVRQGIALSVLYFALSLLLRRRILGFLLALGLATSVHTSAALVIPFLPVMLLTPRAALLLFLALAAGYPIGLWEPIVVLLGGLTGVEIHSTLGAFGELRDRWTGFQLDWYVYSVFWAVAGFVAGPLIVPRHRRRFAQVVQLYQVLLMPYLVFGFASFSNRYAMLGWMFLPMVQAVFVSVVRTDWGLRSLLVLITGTFGIAYFLLRFL